MRILFIHQNAPGQFRHLAPHLAADAGNSVAFLGQRRVDLGPGVRSVRYSAPDAPGREAHRYLQRMDGSVRRGQAAARACQALREEGFEPDVIVAHPGWGEALFVREVLPRARVLSYCEMFYRPEGQDTGFLPELALDLDGRCRLRAWNADLLLGLEAMDRGLAPTRWQRSQHPAAFQPRISVIHEGVDLREVRPDAGARFALPGGRVLTGEDEVVTFVARNLEPVRGFTLLMRALPGLLRRRPRAEVVVCGDDGVSYGARPADGRSWREAMLDEAGFDRRRVHFVGRLERAEYLSLLQVSALHLYLTVPFVLSWSCVEALAAGCLLLGSDVAPVREVIEDGVNGFLVEARDVEGLALRAAELLAHRRALAEVRRRARLAAAERFDSRRCLDAQTQLIREVAG